MGDGHTPPMTLRDYLAAKAMAGFIANETWMKNTAKNRPETSLTRTIAAAAYECADAMIATAHPVAGEG